MTLELHSLMFTDQNFDCPEFYEKVRECFLEFDNDYFILCGDFNVTLNKALTLITVVM